jgi:hypothetical protein
VLAAVTASRNEHKPSVGETSSVLVLTEIEFAPAAGALTSTTHTTTLIAITTAIVPNDEQRARLPRARGKAPFATAIIAGTGVRGWSGWKQLLHRTAAQHCIRLRSQSTGNTC